MKKRRKRTPEEEAAYEEFRRASAERLKRLRELVDKGMAELEAKRAQGHHSG
jgi:hypothetical protein